MGLTITLKDATRGRPTLLTAQEGRLFDLMTGFFSTRLLGIALKRDLFTQLAQGPMDRARITAYLGFPDRACSVFLDGLVATGLLAFGDGAYANSPMADTFLVKGRPEYQGANVKLFESLYQACGELEQALASGSPPNREFSYFFDAPDGAPGDYAALMHESSVVPALLLMEYYDFSDSRWLLDVGGGSGRLAATLASQYSGLNVVLFDLPQVCTTAKDYLTPFPALASRVEIYPGDFFRDDFPEVPDTIVMMRILHDWPDDQVALLLRKAYKALPPGGRLLIYETMRASAASPDETFAISLLMFLISPAGKIRSFDDMTALLRDARFVNIEVTPTAYLYSLVTAQKPNPPA